MSNFNKYSVYGYQYHSQTTSKDKVDSAIEKIIDLHDYKEVKEFINNNFGIFNGDKWFDYPELDKKIYVLNEDNKVEICMLKNEKQYYGKGWKPIK